MAEQVVTASRLTGLPDQRALAMLERLGRSTDARTRDALFDKLAAGRSRFGLVARKHVCHHDQGANDCAATLVEG